MNHIKNKVQLIGNLGLDPQVRTLKNNQKVCNLTMATNETYTNKKGDRVTDTQWHRLTLWGRQADLAERLLEKGREVAVEGKLKHKKYEDKDGITRYTTEVLVEDFLLVGKA